MLHLLKPATGRADAIGGESLKEQSKMSQIAKLMPERRHFPRTQLQMKIQCIRFDPDGGDVVDVLNTVDISRNGLGAITQRPYYPGQRVLVCMPLTSMGGRRNIYATIVRCRPEEEGYNIGIQFDATSSGIWQPEQPAAAAAA